MATQTNTATRKAAIETRIDIATAANSGFEGNQFVQMTIPRAALNLIFADGRDIRIALEDLAPEILTQAIMHGLKQKLVDAAAISRDPDTGREASLDVKFAAVAEVFDRLTDPEAPEWNKRREGGGNSGGLLFRALVQKYDGRKTPEQIKSFLDGKSDKEKAALRKNPDIAKIIDDLRTKDGDTSGDDLLAELDD